MKVDINVNKQDLFNTLLFTCFMKRCEFCVFDSPKHDVECGKMRKLAINNHIIKVKDECINILSE